MSLAAKKSESLEILIWLVDGRDPRRWDTRVLDVECCEALGVGFPYVIGSLHAHLSQSHNGTRPLGPRSRILWGNGRKARSGVGSDNWDIS